jgi:hypothetical protein
MHRLHRPLQLLGERSRSSSQEHFRERLVIPERAVAFAVEPLEQRRAQDAQVRDDRTRVVQLVGTRHEHPLRSNARCMGCPFPCAAASRAAASRSRRWPIESARNRSTTRRSRRPATASSVSITAPATSGFVRLILVFTARRTLNSLPQRLARFLSRTSSPPIPAIMSTKREDPGLDT